MKTALQSAREALNREIEKLELTSTVIALLPDFLPANPWLVTNNNKDYFATVMFKVDTLQDLKDLYTTLTPYKEESSQFGPVHLEVSGTLLRFQWTYSVKDKFIQIWCEVKENDIIEAKADKKIKYYYNPRMVYKKAFQDVGMNPPHHHALISFSKEWAPTYRIFWSGDELPME